MAFDRNLSRGLQSAIDNTPIEDGKLRFAVDTCRIFLDLKNTRIEFTDFIRGLKKDEIKALKNPLPKIYLAADTFELMLYHAEEWLTFGGGNSVADGIGQVIHKTYIKNIKFDDIGNIWYVLGDGTEKIVEGSSVFPGMAERISNLEIEYEDLLQKHKELEEKYQDLQESHDALADAVTNWGSMPSDGLFGEIE